MAENTAESTENVVQVESQSFTCPNCGGTLTFDIKMQKFMCGSCRTEYDIEAISEHITEYDFGDYLAREKKTVPFEGKAQVTCDKCGAEIIFTEYQFACVCPMCSSTQIAAAKQKACILPEGIVPFKVDKQDAQQRFRVWVKKRWFAPNDFKRSYGEGGLKGMYLPFWTYDAEVVSHYSGMGGRTRVVRDRDGKTSMTVDWYPVSGVVKSSFDDVLICASDKEKHINGILPYRTTTEALPYSPAYLSGYYAEIYKFKADYCFERAKDVMDGQMRALADAQIRMSYDQAQVTSLTSRHINVKYKHMLLPLWGAVFGYKGKQFGYLVNGETGRVHGDRPYSIPKITAAVIAGLIILAVIFIASQEGDSYYGYQYYDAATAVSEDSSVYSYNDYMYEGVVL